jgi:glycosyltransferase involved in cell wall biosynthesis
MKTCDVLVLPSLFEGQALVILEAMKCGLPVIITPNTGAAPLIENERQGFVIKTGSIEDLREKMIWCIQHRSEVVEMGRQAHQKASECTWSSYEENVCNAVLKLLN